MNIGRWARYIGDMAARMAGRRLRKYVAPALPVIVTPIALGAAASAGALVFFFRIAKDIRDDDGVWRFDNAGLKLGLRLRTPRRTALMRVVSAMARPDVMIYIGLVSLFLAWRKPEYRARGILLAVSLAGGGSIIGLIKTRFARERPNLPEALAKEATFSFPSGHSFISLCFYGVLAYWWFRSRPDWPRRVLVLSGSTGMILLTGASRVYMGVHYPSDVLAGYAAAIPWLTACLTAYTQYEKRAIAIAPGPKPTALTAARE